MKRVALLTMALVFATTMAYVHCGFCQSDKGKKSEDWAQKKIERMTERLSLTEEQVSQVEVVIKEKGEKKKVVREDARIKMESIKEECSVEIKALLDDDQKVKYDEWKKEREEMKGEGHGYGYRHKHKKFDKEDKESGDES